MVRRILLLWGLWFTTVLLWAQTPIYPVRKDHKSSFIVLLGKQKAGGYKEVVPYYNLIDETYLPWNYLNNQSFKSPFLRFEKDGRLGLLDRQLVEVLPSRYQRIRPLSLHTFAVEEDSLFTVIDQSGKALIKGRFSNICPLLVDAEGDPTYFLVQRNRRWGIYRRSPDSLLFEPRFAVVQWAHSEVLFKVKQLEEQQLWGLADRTGRLVLPCVYTDIIALHPKFLAVHIPDNGWRVISKQETLPGVLSAVTPLSRQWAALSPKRNGPDVIWNVQTQQPVAVLPDSIVYQRFWPFDDQHIVGRLGNGWQGLLDSTLKTVVPAVYDSILRSGEPDRYFVRRRGKWGLLATEDSIRLVHPFEYREVKPFKEGLADVQTETGIGAINRAGMEVAPPLYESLQRPAPNYLKGKTITGNLAMIELGQQDGLVVSKTSSALIDPINIPKNVREWVVHEPGNDGLIPEAPDYKVQDTIRWGVFLKPRFIPEQTPEPLLQKLKLLAANVSSHDVSKFSDKLYALATDEQTVDLAYLSPYFTSTARVIRLYLADGSPVPQSPAMVGYREFQDSCLYTTFIALDGSMGLIDRAGQELRDARGQALHYAYIGPFRANRARVCLSGKLVVSEPDAGNEPRSLADPLEFIRQFQLSVPTQFRERRIKANQIYYTRSAVGEKKPPQWGFIDGRGGLVPGPGFDFVHSFHETDSLALVARYFYKDSVTDPVLQYGLIDTAQRMVVEIQYVRITHLGNNYRVEIKSATHAFNLYYFNAQGRQLYTMKKVPKGFSEGLCALRGPDDRWGFIDTVGVVRIDFLYDAVEGFSEGLAAVFDGVQWSFINPGGQSVFTLHLGKKPKIGGFHDGRCYFMRQGKWGYFDKTGAEVIAADYTWASNFAYGAAAVKIKNPAGKVLPAIVDTAGQFILAPSANFLDIQPFNAFGKAFARQKDNNWVVIDHLGQVVSAAYSEIKPYVAGFANVRRGRLWGSIGLDGKPRVPLSYAVLDVASEGLVAVQLTTAGKWVFIDTLGRPGSVRGAFHQPGRFKEGAAMLGKEALINRKGEQLLEKERVLFFAEGLYGIRKRKGFALFTDGEGNDFYQAQYDSITPFKHGIAKVRLPKKRIWGVVNQRGMYVLYPKYGNIGEQPDGNFVVNPQRYYGLLDRHGQTILETKYDRINLVMCDDCYWEYAAGGEVYRVESGEEIGYFGRDLPVEKRWIWPMQK